MPRPRETQHIGGTLVGAAVGGVLLGPAGAGLLGAGLGGLLGTGANPQRPIPLSTATERYVRERGLHFVSFHREARNRIRVVFGAGRNNFFYVMAALPPNRVPNDPVEIDDQLYDVFQTRLEEWVNRFRGR